MSRASEAGRAARDRRENPAVRPKLDAESRADLADAVATGKDIAAQFDPRLDKQNAGRACVPQSAGALAGRAADGIFRTSSAWSLTSRALRIWRMMSDERVRTHVTGVSLTERRVSRVLTFYVDSSVWVQELSMRRYELFQEWTMLCERHDPDLAVDDVMFKLSKSARAAGHNGSVANYGVQPVYVPARLTPDELDAVRRRVEPITDARLRKSVQDAMTAMFAWKKSKGH
ncbi:MAG: hypothetical protein KHZ24_07750 [Coriobacteriia bacterium]|nr:hypothetical protein [Coriobacteriia bacterium]